MGACIHEARAFMDIMDEWARVKVIANVLGSRYPITLARLRSLGARYARAKFGGRVGALSGMCEWSRGDKGYIKRELVSCKTSFSVMYHLEATIV